MSVSLEDTKRLADLARLEISEKEATAYTEQLNQILALADELEKLDTTNVEPTYTPLSGGMPLRPDVAKTFANQSVLLGSAPELSGTSYVVPRIL